MTICDNCCAPSTPIDAIIRNEAVHVCCTPCLMNLGKVWGPDTLRTKLRRVLRKVSERMKA